MTPAEMAEEGARLSKLLDGALRKLREQVELAAEAERVYRQAKAKAWLHATEGIAPAREAWVNGETADLRFTRDLAVGMERACREAIRSRQQQISLLQSVASAHRAEADLAKVGP